MLILFAGAAALVLVLLALGIAALLPSGPKRCVTGQRRASVAARTR